MPTRRPQVVIAERRRPPAGGFLGADSALPAAKLERLVTLRRFSGTTDDRPKLVDTSSAVEAMAGCSPQVLNLATNPSAVRLEPTGAQSIAVHEPWNYRSKHQSNTPAATGTKQPAPLANLVASTTGLR